MPTTISDYLKAEIVDPTLPRDSFVPPDDEYAEETGDDQTGDDQTGDGEYNDE
jgi:hypothetical protein